MQVISGVNNSAFFAQSAYSAATATFDKNGNDIAETYYPANNPSGFITGVDLSDYATTSQVAEKLDTTAFSTVSGNFLTAHQDISDLMPKSESANFYPMTGNPSGFLTELPAGTMNESEFEYDANDKISGYNGSAFAGGSEVPEGVMVESGLEYNAVNEISGYNGSAIAQYGAEKQWLVHDDTLVHASNSAQYALGVNLSAVAKLLGVDETVLWTGSLTSTFSLSESMSAFNRVRFVMHCDNTNTQLNQNLIHEIEWNNGNIITMADVVRYPATSTFPIYDYRWGANVASNGKEISNVFHEMYWHAKDSWGGGGLNENAAYYPVKVVGIGRRSSKE